MAVQYVQEKSSSGLGNLLGGLATIGGALTGQPWLSALGTGINMMGGGGAGNSGGNSNAGGMFGQSPIGKILDGIVCGNWYNPADGNLAKPNAGLNQILQALTGNLFGGK